MGMQKEHSRLEGKQIWHDEEGKGKVKTRSNHSMPWEIQVRFSSHLNLLFSTLQVLYIEYPSPLLFIILLFDS